MDIGNRTELRRSERTAVSIPVRLVVSAGSHSTACEARLTNLSAHGARIETSAVLTPNQIVELIPSQGPRYAVQGRVVWFEPPEAGIEILDSNLDLPGNKQHLG